MYQGTGQRLQLHSLSFWVVQGTVRYLSMPLRTVKINCSHTYFKEVERVHGVKLNYCYTLTY